MNVAKKDFLNLAVLLSVALVLFYPLFYSEYAYTDENVQLWLYKKGSDFHMFIPQGRYITDLLFQRLYSAIDTIKELTYLRLFSLTGWLICIPVWYFVIEKIVLKEGLPEELVFFSMLYLITTPPFSVYVQWASCLELFIANTSGLLSGYILLTTALVLIKTE